MKKFKLILLFTLIAGSIFSQQTWQTTPLNVNESINAKLGSRNDRSVNFVTNDITRLLIDSLGNVNLPGLALPSSTDDDEVRFVYIDPHGNIGAKGINGEGTILQCGRGKTPWLLGGNNISYTPNNLNIIGPCNEFDFILQSYGRKSIFLTTAAYTGIGENNFNPSAVLDVSDPNDPNLVNSPGGAGQRQHTRIYGDLFGGIEATLDMNLFYSREFNIRQGSYVNGAWTSYFNMDNNGNIGLSTSGANRRLTVNAGSGDGIQSQVNNGSKAYSVYNNTNETFAVYGSGYTEMKIYSPNGMPNNRALTIKDMSAGRDLFVVKTNGTVYAREVEITNVPTFPDYVFEKGYKLDPIKEVAEFIEKNKHLPGFENGEYYEKNGVNLNSIILKQQEKIEELMLYVIALEKRIDNIENK